ncbi:MAG: SDR family oxidoreductase [Pseudomonadota bacterium]
MVGSSSPVALVTGAARGIGYAIAELFLARGYAVGLLDIDRETLERANQTLATRGSTLTLACDVADVDAVRSRVSHLADTFGRIDALVNNAGTAVFKPLLETTTEEWQRSIDVNLSGPFFCAQACAPIMIANGGGAIVNIGSISGQRASTLRVAYGTTKAAIGHLTKQQAVELGEVGIRVNAVAPGPVDTAMAKQVHTSDIRAGYHDALPLNRYGLEEEIANAVVFLCSDEAAYITGQVLGVDGGFDAAGIGLPSLRR